MPAARKVPDPRKRRPARRLVQPPLPLAADPGPRLTTPATANTAGGPGGTTNSGPSWRLDERTRRAGRLGVAAARAALARSGRVGHDRQANAA